MPSSLIAVQSKPATIYVNPHQPYSRSGRGARTIIPHTLNPQHPANLLQYLILPLLNIGQSTLAANAGAMLKKATTPLGT